MRARPLGADWLVRHAVTRRLPTQARHGRGPRRSRGATRCSAAPRWSNSAARRGPRHDVGPADRRGRPTCMPGPNVVWNHEHQLGREHRVGHANWSARPIRRTAPRSPGATSKIPRRRCGAISARARRTGRRSAGADTQVPPASPQPYRGTHREPTGVSFRSRSVSMNRLPLVARVYVTAVVTSGLVLLGVSAVFAHVDDPARFLLFLLLSCLASAIKVTVPVPRAPGQPGHDDVAVVHDELRGAAGARRARGDADRGGGRVEPVTFNVRQKNPLYRTLFNMAAWRSAWPPPAGCTPTAAARRRRR